MRSRWLRCALFALLLPALPPVAAVAVCLQAGPAACCCSDAGCPKPGDARIEGDTCCEMTDGTALPPTAPAGIVPAPAASRAADAPPAAAAVPVLAVAASATAPARRDGGPPNTVPLFTLNASLLI